MPTHSPLFYGETAVNLLENYKKLKLMLYGYAYSVVGDFKLKRNDVRLLLPRFFSSRKRPLKQISSFSEVNLTAFDKKIELESYKIQYSILDTSILVIKITGIFFVSSILLSSGSNLLPLKISRRGAFCDFNRFFQGIFQEIWIIFKPEKRCNR